MDVVIDLLL